MKDMFIRFQQVFLMLACQRTSDVCVHIYGSQGWFWTALTGGAVRDVDGFELSSPG